MAIQKNENFKWYTAAMLCLIPGWVLANDYDSLGILKESYQVSEAEKSNLLIERLQNAQQTCENQSLKNRIQYRIGVLYFKAEGLKQAYKQFQPLAVSGQCSVDIQLAAMNMAAQSAKMQGRDGTALEYYDKLIQELMEIDSKSDKAFAKSTFDELYISSVHGKADIYTFQKKYVNAAEVYTQAIQALKSGFVKDTSRYLPDLQDRLSQLHLKAENVQEYLDAASIIVNNYPDYSRTALVKLESFAVQFLNEKNIEQDYTNGSLDAPAQLILYIKENEDSQDIPRIESLFNQMSDTSIKNYGCWLIKYHHAWFLDAIGKRDDSCRLFGEIIAGIEVDSGERDYLTRTILTYSKLQKALMDGEYERYKEAMECLDSIENDMIGTHVSKLSDSIRNSLEILKREVPKNEDTNH